MGNLVFSDKDSTSFRLSLMPVTSAINISSPLASLNF